MTLARIACIFGHDWRYAIANGFRYCRTCDKIERLPK